MTRGEEEVNTDKKHRVKHWLHRAKRDNA